MAFSCKTLTALAGCLTLALAAHAEDVVFVQIASQTNPASKDNAKGMAVGIQAYFDAVNAKGGIQGNKLVLKIKDDNLQADQMVQLTKESIADPSVVGLLGLLNSAGLAEVAKQDLAAQGQIAVIAPLQGDKHVIGAGNVFPFRSGYANEIEALLKEAKNWGKDTLSVVNMGIAFGPALAKVALERAQAMGLKVVSHSVIDAKPDHITASVQAAVKDTTAAQPKAILVLAAGRPAYEFVRTMREAPGGKVQMYGVSVLLHDDLVAQSGKDKAHGMVLSQSLPYPYTMYKPVITEYQQVMKRYAPKEPISYSSLEGFAGAKIAAEAVRRAGTPSRERILAALQQFGTYDLGGISVNYDANGRQGWGGVELTIIGSEGQLRK
jgi:ABC-type branched-subunit amino acid transport system substrate-binding protein